MELYSDLLSIFAMSISTLLAFSVKRELNANDFRHKQHEENYKDLLIKHSDLISRIHGIELMLREISVNVNIMNKKMEE